MMIHDYKTDQVPIAITMDDGTVAIYGFMLRAASPTLPYGAKWEIGPDGKPTGCWLRDLTDANIFAELTKAFPSKDRMGLPKPQPVRYVVTTWDAVPDGMILFDLTKAEHQLRHRPYRNALRHGEDGFAVDMVEARQLHLDLVRRARTAQLGELDKEWMRASSRGDAVTAASVEATRQALRDAPAELPVHEAKTLDELKAMWPEGLPR